MIKATFYKKDDNYTRFVIDGHAGYADAGKDIVCSAVTALSFNCINSIEKLTEAKFSVKNKKSGKLEFEFNKEGSTAESQLFIKSLVLGLTEVYSEYGDTYLRLYFKEV